MKKTLISIYPFAKFSKAPLDILDSNNLNYDINPFDRRMNESDFLSIIDKYDCLIAGTEKITEKILDKAINLKHISRVGVGYNSIDLNACNKRNIKISYTPDAPSSAVAEFTIGLFINLLRGIHISNNEMHKNQWSRYTGKNISESEIGIIGAGRIAVMVIESLIKLGAKKISFNDINNDQLNVLGQKINFKTKEKIFKTSDIISLHVPLNNKTLNMISEKELNLFKNDAIIINTSRGGIINEEDLYQVLLKGKLAGVALDVFENEPYDGVLSTIDRCLLTSHISSMAQETRINMEKEAVKEVLRFLTNQSLSGLIPEQINS